MNANPAAHVSRNAHLARLVEGLGRPRILVVGDLILDHYVFGRVDRISPEAPIPVLRVESEEWKLGGAGSVVANLRKLGAEVSVIGCVGRDEQGDQFLELLRQLGVDAAGVVRAGDRPTTLKTRFIASARAGCDVQHLLRVDRERTHEYEDAARRELARHVRRLVPECAAAIVSDYGKGLLRDGSLLRDAVVPEARRKGSEVLLDPKKQADWRAYRGVTAITPSRAETEIATGIAPETPEAWARAAEKLLADLDLECVCMTLDKDGIFFCSRGAPGRHFPTRPIGVIDVTGAGDMVLSVIGLARACGVAWDDALDLANVAGGLEVQRVGVCPLAREEIAADLLGRDAPFREKIVSLERFLEVRAELRRQGKRVAWTNGCFDLLHVGHTSQLELARALGDVLVVGLNSDRSVRAWKDAPGRPLVPERDRAQVLAALAAVDYVILFDDPTPIRPIEAIVPEVLVKGEDYKDKEVVGREVVEAAGGRVVFAPLVPGISTTELVRRARESEAAEAVERGSAP